MSPLDLLRRHLDESIAVKRRLAESAVLSTIVDAAQRLTTCVQNGGKIMFCGNGGSAADSQHLAAELTGRLRSSMERPAIAAIALTTDTSFLTARANDYGFDEVFERLVEGLGRRGDALVGISTSGGSRNVIRAVARAKDMGITTIGFLGGAGGQLAGMVDVPIIVPSESTQHIQECHITIGHVICEIIEESLHGALRSTNQQCPE